MALNASLRAVTDLAPETIDAMYALMTTHYHHVRQDVFDQDLSRKDAVILLHEVETTRLCGFSTQVCFDHEHEGENLRILFSGDTIIHPDHWGGMQLPVMFGRMMQALKRAAPHRRLFWMLISKGFRTYRFLPVFFHQFYPRHDRPTPAWERSLMDALGRRRFSPSYDGVTGLIRGGEAAQSLRTDLADDRCHQTRPDPHIDFFFETNPGHARGDELLCLSEFDDSNLKPFILRQLNRDRVEFPHGGRAQCVPPVHLSDTGQSPWRAALRAAE
jgi:hypothetical protein